MLINQPNLDLTYRGFNKRFTDAFMEAAGDSDRIVMTVPSQTREENYGWLGSMPSLREWIGPRVVNGLSAYGFTIVNREFESTVEVGRNDIEDDRLGIFGPFFSEMGGAARRHKEELIFSLLGSGFAANGYDGQFFFDTDHPLTLDDGSKISVANTDGGSGTPWYLLDLSRSIKPIIWQERSPYLFESMTQPDSPNVFLNRSFIYGVRARVNVGFGLWQLAWGSKQPLNAANYKAARTAMMGFRGQGGKLLGIKPTHLIVPPSLEEDAMTLLNNEYGTGGVSNPWKGTATPIVTPWLT